MSTKKLYTERISLKTKLKRVLPRSFQWDGQSQMIPARFIHAVAEEDEVLLAQWRTRQTHNYCPKELNKLLTFCFFDEPIHIFERWTDANKFKHLIKCCDNECKKAETQDYCATLWSIFAMSHQNKPFNRHNIWIKICCLINCLIKCTVECRLRKYAKTSRTSSHITVFNDYNSKG